jgi:hypothetical protein
MLLSSEQAGKNFIRSSVHLYYYQACSMLSSCDIECPGLKILSLSVDMCNAHRVMW